MLLNAVKNTEFESNVETQKFKFEMNSMAFYAVINGIYADKIKSPMRELATNARDGHALAGKLDVPFDIKLPTQFNPVFSVRDYGCSMTHDEIMGLYSTMFASSKRNSNEAVGMIGLGSKSPFSYVNQFTVTAWQDGIRRDYVASIGQDDEPEIGLLASEPSDEPTGVEVTIAVKLEDIATFKAAANEVFFGFDPKPNIDNFTFPEVDATYKGEGYTLYAQNAQGWPFQQRAYARQGCVIYPIDPSALGPRFKDNPIWGMPIVVDFPIGQLSVNTSREALGYDAMTIKNIEARMKVVLDDMTGIVQKQIDAAPRYIDACKIFADNRVTNIIYKTLGGTLKYRGGDDLLRFQFGYKTTDHATFSMRRYSPEHPWVGKLNQNIAFSNIRVPTTLTAHPDTLVNSKMIFDIEDENLENVPSRVRQVMLDSKDKHVYWLKAKTRARAIEIWKAMGQPDIVELKNTTPLIVKRTGAAAQRQKDFRVFMKLGQRILENDLVDISQPVDIVYLYNDMQTLFFRKQAVSKNGGMYSFHNTTRRDSMYRHVKDLLEAVDDPDKIRMPFVFNNGFMERLKNMKNVNPVEFHEYYLALLKKNGLDIDAIAKYCNDRDETIRMMPSQYRSYEHGRLKNMAEIMIRDKVVVPDLVKQFYELAKKSDNQKKDDFFKDDPMVKWYDLRHMLRNFYPDIFADKKNAGEVNKTITDQLSQSDTHLLGRIQKEYPLINAACNTAVTMKHYMELLAK